MSDIKKNIGKGIFYTFLSKYSNIVVSIIIGAILAHLLTPQEFGIVVIVSVFISFFNLLSNIGIGPAIVQIKTLSNSDIESIFSFSLILGAILTTIFFLSAPLIASFYNNEKLIRISQLMSLAIFFQALRIVPQALLLKKLQFRNIGIISVIVHIISGSIAILLAYLGYSYFALVLNNIISALLMFTIYFYMTPIKLTFKINFSSIRKIAKFSIFQFFFNFINYFSRNTDNLLIGKFFGEANLGFYDKAYKLMMMPVQNLTHVITPVLHPVLSNCQDDKETIYKAYWKIVKLLASIGFPLSVFFFYSSSSIITILYGEQWILSIPIFKLLALTIGIQIVLSSTGAIFQSTNRTDLMFYAGLIGAILMVSGISYGIFIEKNLEAIGIGLIIAFVINFLLAFYLLVVKSLEKKYFNFMSVFLHPLFTSIIIAIILGSFNSFYSGNKFITLVLNFIIFLLISIFFFSISKENRLIFKELLELKKK